VEPQLPVGELYKYQENERRRSMSQIELSNEDLKQEMIKELAKLGSEGLYERGF